MRLINLLLLGWQTIPALEVMFSVFCLVWKAGACSLIRRAMVSWLLPNNGCLNHPLGHHIGRCGGFSAIALFSMV